VNIEALGEVVSARTGSGSADAVFPAMAGVPGAGVFPGAEARAHLAAAAFESVHGHRFGFGGQEIVPGFAIFGETSGGGFLEPTFAISVLLRLAL
jgi:hypothetical protein